MSKFESLSLRYGERFFILDQRQLPHEEEWLEIIKPQDMVDAISTLAVRGAPLIGVSAALTLAYFSKDKSFSIEEWEQKLRSSRPTAVNLMNALDRVLLRWKQQGVDGLVKEAEEIYKEDVRLCLQMAERGNKLINDNDGILTHCNTGGLATVGIGTALGVIRHAWESGKKIHVYVDETRPLLQGARLTSWELKKLGIPYTLICDNMAAVLMREKKIQKIFVGADRVAVNGDSANKIGTYGLSVNAKHHNIPFYIVAPSTTYDPNCLSGDKICIEERSADEVRAGKSPTDAKVWNPAFDVTPKQLITKIIFEDREW
ncbi:MAG: S-methyl-5-thioribose-1-phosphate isomerase [Oligoflexia bacterium]|nr:S-methyl-5-thioribose-1-phosphate isomerase [Oligoflexia bacterium]